MKMGLTMVKSGTMLQLFDYSCNIARVVGVLPLVVRGTQIEVSKVLALYDIVMILSQVVMDTAMWYRDTIERSDMPILPSLFRLTQQVMTTLTLAASLFWIIWSKPALQEALDELVKFEKIVKGKDISLSARLLGLLYFTLVVMGLTDFLILSPAEPIWLRFALCARLHSSAWMVFSVAANFTSLIKIVENSYQVLSDWILVNLKASQNLKDTQRAAEHLVSASEALNEAFGPQMLLITSACFILITTNTYTLIKSVSSFAVCWIIVYTLIMLHLISSCTSAVQAADEFEKTLYRTVLEDRSGILSQEVRSCLHFTNNRKVEFHAFGFFPVNFSLAGSMVAAATTYLVILIQTGSTRKSGTNSNSTNVE